MTFAAPDLPEKFDAFRDAVAWCAGCNIFWALQSDEGRNREANEVWGELQIYRISKIGIDDIRYTEVGDPVVTDLQPAQCGNRLLQFQLNMKSRSQEHFTTGWYAATKVQQRINSPFVYEQWLNPYEMSLATIGDVVDTLGGVAWDNRLEDLAVLEINMNTILTDTDAAVLGSWIETIEASTGFKNVDGNDWDSSLQLDDEVMP